MVGSVVPALASPLRRALGLESSRRLERASRAMLAAAVIGSTLIVLTQFVIAPLAGHFTGQFEDFGPLLKAGQAANTGADIYGGFVQAAPTSLVTNLGFDYLPIVAFFMRPLAAIPHDAAVTVWLWLILGCITAATVIVAREVLPATWPRAAIGFCVAVLFAPLVYNVWHGQMNALVYLSLALALRAWIRGDEVACGVALGLGCVSKVAPAVLLLLLLRRGWWRGLSAGVATVLGSLVAGGVLVGFDRVVEWFTRVLPVLGRPDGWYFNMGLNALINRLADHNVYRLDPPSTAMQAAALVASAACVLGATWAVRRGAASLERRSLEFAAGVIAMLLAGTIAWYSAYGHLAIPLLVVAGVAARRGLDRLTLGAAALAAIVVGVGAPLFLAGGGMGWVRGTHGSPLWRAALQVDSLPAYAATAFLVVLVVSLRRQRELPDRPAVRTVAA